MDGWTTGKHTFQKLRSLFQEISLRDQTSIELKNRITKNTKHGHKEHNGEYQLNESFESLAAAIIGFRRTFIDTIDHSLFTTHQHKSTSA
jgi:hypothetical protein